MKLIPAKLFRDRKAGKSGAPQGMAIGRFAGRIAGLKYQSPSGSGFTNERGEFPYRSGEAVTFLIGDVVLGTAVGAPIVTLSHLVHRVAGKIDKLHDPIVTNLARFVSRSIGTAMSRTASRFPRSFMTSSVAWRSISTRWSRSPR